MKKKRLGKRNRRRASSQEDRIKKKCLSCGVQFALSGSGKRQKYCSKCARRGRMVEAVDYRALNPRKQRPQKRPPRLTSGLSY